MDPPPSCSGPVGTRCPPLRSRPGALEGQSDGPREPSGEGQRGRPRAPREAAGSAGPHVSIPSARGVRLARSGTEDCGSVRAARGRASRAWRTWSRVRPRRAGAEVVETRSGRRGGIQDSGDAAAESAPQRGSPPVAPLEAWQGESRQAARPRWRRTRPCSHIARQMDHSPGPRASGGWRSRSEGFTARRRLQPLENQAAKRNPPPRPKTPEPGVGPGLHCSSRRGPAERREGPSPGPQGPAGARRPWAASSTWTPLLPLLWAAEKPSFRTPAGLHSGPHCPSRHRVASAAGRWPLQATPLHFSPIPNFPATEELGPVLIKTKPFQTPTILSNVSRAVSSGIIWVWVISIQNKQVLQNA